VIDRIDITRIHTVDDALAIITLLVARVQQLEEQVARLSKDSSTSSKPPSSDMVKPPSERRQPGKRKVGGQPSHTGKDRVLLPPDQVDVTVNSRRWIAGGGRDVGVIGGSSPELRKA
jgi:hypothetical protein